MPMSAESSRHAGAPVLDGPDAKAARGPKAKEPNVGHSQGGLTKLMLGPGEPS